MKHHFSSEYYMPCFLCPCVLCFWRKTTPISLPK